MTPTSCTHRTQKAGLLLLVAMLLGVLWGSPGHVAAQTGKPYGPSVPAAPAAAPQPAPDPKDRPDAPAQEPQAPAPLSLIQSAATTTPFSSCQSPIQNNVEITSTSQIVITSCSLTVPVTTTLYVNATASVGLASNGSNFETRVGLGVDGSALTSTYRWINVYTDNGDGTDENLAVSTLHTVGPGSHTFEFRASRYSGGNVRFYSPSVQAVAIPAGSGLTTCSAPTSLNVQSDSTTATTIASCTLTTSITSTVYLDANGSLGYSSGTGGAYEAKLNLSQDGNPVAPSRWVNVDADSGDGTDRGLALSRLVTVGPGEHTFALNWARTSTTTTTMRIYYPQLSAIAIPNDTRLVSSCAGALQDFATTNPAAQNVTSCSLTLPITTTVFLNGNASLGLPAGGINYEARMRLTVNGSPLDVSRWVNVYTDSGDGTDKSTAISYLVTLGPGTYSFGLSAQLYSGSGATVQLYGASITALALNDPPTISTVSSQTATAGTPIGPIPITVGSSTVPSGTLALSADSSNPAVVPVGNIAFGGSGTERTVTVTPAGVGSTTITITLNDGGNTTTTSFVVTVEPRRVYLPVAVKNGG